LARLYVEFTVWVYSDALSNPGSQVIRGNSVVMLEALERIGGDDRRG